MRIGVSEGSVKSTFQQLFSKTGVRTRSLVVGIGLEQYREQIQCEAFRSSFAVLQPVGIPVPYRAPAGPRPPWALERWGESRFQELAQFGCRLDLRNRLQFLKCRSESIRETPNGPRRNSSYCHVSTCFRMASKFRCIRSTLAGAATAVQKYRQTAVTLPNKVLDCQLLRNHILLKSDLRLR
jgi:hypothetical protein